MSTKCDLLLEIGTDSQSYHFPIDSEGVGVNPETTYSNSSEISNLLLNSFRLMINVDRTLDPEVKSELASNLVQGKFKLFKLKDSSTGDNFELESQTYGEVSDEIDQPAVEEAVEVEEEAEEEVEEPVVSEPEAETETETEEPEPEPEPEVEPTQPEKSEKVKAPVQGTRKPVIKGVQKQVKSKAVPVEELKAQSSDIDSQITALEEQLKKLQELKAQSSKLEQNKTKLSEILGVLTAESEGLCEDVLSMSDVLDTEDLGTVLETINKCEILTNFVKQARDLFRSSAEV